MNEDRLGGPDVQPADEEITLRPRTLDEFLGQKRIVGQLRLFVAAARERGEAVDHILLAGPPGLGKTSLAHIVAAEMGTRVMPISGPGLERKGDIASILTALEPRDILFIDEIHRLPRAVEEILYSAMEDGHIDVVIGQGPGARALRLELAPFTLVGATTRAGLLTQPLRDRFGIDFRLEHYPLPELELIVQRTALILGVEIEEDASREIARRSRGTPRVANRILRRVRDVAQVRRYASVDSVRVAEALVLLEVDGDGLDRTDWRILRTIADMFSGGPVGLSTLAVALGEDDGTIEEIYEPYLIQRGLVHRTPRGRVLTRRGRQLTGMAGLPDGQTLFPS